MTAEKFSTSVHKKKEGRMYAAKMTGKGIVSLLYKELVLYGCIYVWKEMGKLSRPYPDK